MVFLLRNPNVRYRFLAAVYVEEDASMQMVYIHKMKSGISES